MTKVIMFDAAYPPPVIGGKEKQAHLLAKSLLQQGILVQALSYNHNGNKCGEHEGVMVRRVSRGLLGTIKLLAILFKNRNVFSILHIHTPSRIGKVLALMGRFLGYRIVFKFPGMHLLDSRYWFDRIAWSAVLKVVDLFVVLEEDTRNKLKLNKVSSSKIFFASNGVEIKSSVSRATSSFSPLRLIFVGRLVPVKACDQLIRACALLRDNGLDFVLNVIGDGPLSSDLKILVDSLQLTDNVVFCGYASSPLDFMIKSDILVLSSLHEGMSNVILEAMSIGLPIVATDVGAVRNQLGFFGEQFLCSTLAPDCLANKIQMLAGDPDLYAEYSAYLYQRGRSKFAIDVIAQSYLCEYRNLFK